jgi:hypothetical protein
VAATAESVTRQALSQAGQLFTDNTVNRGRQSGESVLQEAMHMIGKTDPAAFRRRFDFQDHAALDSHLL